MKTLADLAALSEVEGWWVVVDERQILQPVGIPLLIKIHRKRGMGWQISLDEPKFNPF